MICQRDGCEKAVPPERRKYCGLECAKLANRERANEQSRRRAVRWREFVKRAVRG